MEEDFIFDFSTDDFSNDYEEDHLEAVEDNEDDIINNNSVEDDDNPEEVDREDEDKEDDDPDKADDESSSDIFSSLASFVQEQGILSSSLDLSNKEVKTAEDFSKLINEEVAFRTKQEIEERIANVDVNKLAQHRDNIQNLSNLSEQDFKEDIDLAKRIIEQDLLNQNLPDRVVKNYMRRLVSSEEEVIIEEALNSKDSIINYNKIKQEEEYNRYELQKQEAIKNAQEDLKKLQSSIYETKELLPGFIPNKTIRDKVFSHITNPVAEDGNGNPITQLVKDSYEDPLGFQIRLHTFYELTDGFRNMDKLGVRQKSNAVKDLEKAFAEKPNYNSGASYKVDKNSYDGPLKYDNLNI